MMEMRPMTLEPKTNPRAHVHPSAIIEGDVTIGKNCRIGAGACINGKLRPVRIGDNTTIGALCVIESTEYETVHIGEWVTIQPGVVIQGANVGDWASLGANCVLCESSSVGIWSFVAECAVLKSFRQIPDRYLGTGSPAKLVGEHASRQVQMAWKEKKQQLVNGTLPCDCHSVSEKN